MEYDWIPCQNYLSQMIFILIIKVYVWPYYMTTDTIHEQYNIYLHGIWRGRQSSLDVG